MNANLLSAPATQNSPFPSVEVLRAEHRELLRRRRDEAFPEEALAPEFTTQIEQFLRRGQATGTVLDGERDRRDAQSILDYWTTSLARDGQHVIDAELAEFDPEQAPDLADDQCPYLGLNAFRQDNQSQFFGRERLVEEMLRLLTDQRLLFVVGPSGCGKSSLVLAGLLPGLTTGRLPGSESWQYYRPLTPGSDALTNLAHAVRPPGEEGLEWVAKTVASFRRDPAALCQLVEKSGTEPVVLLVDQFEELFTLSADEAGREAFIGNLIGLATSPVRPHRVVITLRSDFESHLARFPVLQPFLQNLQLRIVPTALGPSDLRLAIEGPAQRVGLRFADGLVARLVKEVLGEPAALPLLQFTLLKLWEKRHHNRVSNEAYDSLGGARLALARSADEFFDKLIPQDQESVRRICLRLVRPGEGMEVVRDRILRAALVSAIGGNADRVLDKLIDAHLLRATHGEKAADEQVEVVHEALIRNWPRFVEWQDQARDELRQRARLTDTAELWNARGRDSAHLLRGKVLEEAARYQDLRPLEAEFLTASRDEAEKAVREQAEADRRERAVKAWWGRLYQWGSIAGAVFFVLAVGLSIFALQQYKQFKVLAERGQTQERNLEILKSEGENQRIESERLNRVRKEQDQLKQLLEGFKKRTELASRLVLAAQTVAYNGELALLLVRKAFEADPDLAKRLTAEQTHFLYLPLLNESLPEKPSDLLFRTLPTTAIAFDFNGKHLAEISPDGKRVYLSAIDRREERSLNTEGNTTTTCLAFSRDGKRLLTGSAAGKLIVWDAETTGSKIEPLLQDKTPRLESQVTAVAFNHAVRQPLCAAASLDGRAIVWREETGEVLYRFKDDELNHFTALVFHISPNNIWVGTVSTSGKAQVWDVSREGPLVSFPYEDTGRVIGITLDNNGGSNTVATINDAGSVRASKIVVGPDNNYSTSQLFKFETSQSSFPTGGIRFSPDGKQLNTWGAVGNLRVSDGKTGQLIGGITQPVQVNNPAVTLSPDGKRFAICRYSFYESSPVAGIHVASIYGQAATPLGPYAVAAQSRTFFPPVIAVYHMLEPSPLVDQILKRTSTTRYSISISDYIQILTYVAPEKQTQLQKWDPFTVDAKSADDAVKLLKEALDIPGFQDNAELEARRLVAEALVDRSAVLLRNGRSEEAENCTSKAKELTRSLHLVDGRGSQQLLVYAHELARLKKLDEAIATFTRAAEADPKLDIDELKKQAKVEAAQSYRYDGNAQAQQGKYDDALKNFQMAANLQAEAEVAPALRIIPESEAARLSAAFHQRLATTCSNTFKLAETTRELDQAQRLYPKLTISPELEARRLVAAARRRNASTLALSGNLESAEAEFQRAAEIDGDQKLDPPDEARRLAAPWVVQQANAAASRLDVDEARTLFQKAAKFDPALKIPMDDVLRSAELKRVRILATAGKIAEAVKRLDEVETQYPDKPNTLDLVAAFNALCWYGTLGGEAEKVTQFGDKAIKAALSLKLAPETIATYHDSYGVNLAVRGKYKEASQEFSDYLTQIKGKRPLPEAAIEKRGEWLKQLEMGKNPFVQPEVLKALKNEG